MLGWHRYKWNIKQEEQKYCSNQILPAAHACKTNNMKKKKKSNPEKYISSTSWCGSSSNANLTRQNEKYYFRNRNTHFHTLTSVNIMVIGNNKTQVCFKVVQLCAENRCRIFILASRILRETWNWRYKSRELIERLAPIS